ncbi:MAG: hypothetical protein PVI33_00085 [Candidatus Omnitrophota bacterium]|jgi:hypothetical protein
MPGFLYRDVSLTRSGRKGWVFAKGEVSNNTAKNYQTAAFRFSLFAKDKIVWTGIFKIRGLRKGQAKPFEFHLEGLDYKEITTISKQEIFFESGY